MDSKSLKKNIKKSNQPNTLTSMSKPTLETIIQRLQASPQSVTPTDIVILQKLIGNHAVNQLLLKATLINNNKNGPQDTGLKKEKYLEDNPTLDQKNASKLESNHDKINKTNLPNTLKSGLESLSNFSMDNVKVHYNSDKPYKIGALAYTQGTDIHLAPGQEKYLPHEAWHVVQQAQGLVQPTFQMKDTKINTDNDLENKADKMGNLALSYSNQSNLHELKTINISNSPLQLKGGISLSKRLNQIIKWIQDKIILDTEDKSLFDKIREYDELSKKTKPTDQIKKVQSMIEYLKTWQRKNFLSLKDAEIHTCTTILELLNEELYITTKQRLQKYSKNFSSPYDLMTDEGMLWNSTYFEHSTKRLRKNGKSYFDKLSKMNMCSILNEKKALQKKSTLEWYASFVAAAKETLSNAVISHYTTAKRAQAMQADGMKSKIMLERDTPVYQHNTSIYDELGLGNSGFLFFFIESPRASFRQTRFSKGDPDDKPARISIPILDSRLLTDGWIMLSDFAQREYPDIMTKNESTSEDFTSWLPTRSVDAQVEKPEFTKLVRHFNPGLTPFGDAEIEIMSSITDDNKRMAFSAVAPQALGDKDSRQTYTGPEGPLDIPDRLFNNILVGKDIIPGLAMRAGLEVYRIYQVNPALGLKMSTLRGDALMLLILKDLFRPQAMIPNSLRIKDQYIQLLYP